MSTTDTVEFPVPGPAPLSVSATSFGMACSVGAILALVYCYDLVFSFLPKAEDVFRSIKVHMPLVSEVMSRYGWILWSLVALCAVLSVVEAFRRPPTRRTVAIQVAAFASSLILVFLAKEAMWGPLVGLMRGIGTEK
jgi:hypothetical protein